MKNNFNTFVKNEVLKNIIEFGKDLNFFVYLYLNEHYSINSKNNLIQIKLLHWEELANFFEEFFKQNQIEYQIENNKNKNKDESKKEKIFLDKFNFEKINNLEFNFESILKNRPYYLIQALFLTKGYVNDPNSRYYHFEIRSKYRKYLLHAIQILKKQNIFLKYLEKDSNYYIYVKKASQIADLLKYIRASESIMSYEDVRIERDFISQFQKIQVIDQYNYFKIKRAAKKQQEAISQIIANGEINNLKWNIQLLAKFRLNNLDLSLNELTSEFNKAYDLQYSKSAVYHWLKQIKELGAKDKDDK